VIRVLLGPRLVRAARRLGSTERAEVEEALLSVARNFGNPHAHGGLGLRKLGPALWECRVGLELRIVLLHDADRLRTYDLMTHDEVRKWLKSR